MIKNLKNNKIYIGQSIDLDRRIKSHIRDLNKGHHRNQYLQRAWNKYGEKNFSFTILDYCEISELDNKEKNYIVKFNSLVDHNGYNLDSGGNLNKNFTEVTRKKMSEQRTGDKNSRAIITSEIAENIKIDMAKGLSRNELMLKYNVSRSTLFNIATGVNWASVRSDLNNVLKSIEESKRNQKENEILSLANNGLNHLMISTETGVPISTISKILLRMGFTTHRKEENEFEKILFKKFKKLVEIHNTSVLQISNELGISRNKIERILIKYSSVDVKDVPLYSDEEIKALILEQERMLEKETKKIIIQATNILQKRLDGMKLTDISKKYSVSVSYINDLINGHTLKNEPDLIILRNSLKKCTTIEKEERKLRNFRIVDLYVNKGYSRKKVADIVGVTENTVKCVVQSFRRAEKNGQKWEGVLR
nr:GIY-YIG nuclease family protein [Metabacillus idriensis]